jgi:hypothetical protein
LMPKLNVLDLSVLKGESHDKIFGYRCTTQ